MPEVLAMLAKGLALDPVALLRPYRVAVTVPEALQYLWDLVQPVKLLGLYKHFFPAEFAASKAQPFPVGRQIYSDMEREFFVLVNDRLFPLAYWFVDMDNEPADGEYGERSDGIPVWPEALDWEEGDIAQLSMGWRLLLALCRYTSLRNDYAPDFDVEDEIADRVGGLGEVENPKMVALRVGVLCGRGNSPLKEKLQDALEMILRETGCPWLDAYEDEAIGPYIDARWSIEEIEWLRDEYESAQETKGRAGELIAWLEERYENRLLLCDLWERALKEDQVLAAAEERLLAEDEEEDGDDEN